MMMRDKSVFNHQRNKALNIESQKVAYFFLWVIVTFIIFSLVHKDSISKAFNKAWDSSHESSSGLTILRVDDFGANKGNGLDDTNAFKEAWKEACSAKGSVVLETSKITYLLKPLKFKGPCKPNKIVVRIYGTLDASTNRSDYKSRHWLIFKEVNNLTIEGGGTLNGNGQVWWKNSCKRNKSLPCTVAPMALTFRRCDNLRVRDLRVKDAQKFHVIFEICDNVTVSNLNVTADARSPNTDGIHVSRTKHISISDCFIATGDDCISIVSGSHSVRATDITCGPGHGIRGSTVYSIGSLGAKSSKSQVSDVMINRARLSHSTNGLRIKTWQGGSGSASNIKFLNVEMNNVQNPIIIDQNYCDQRIPCPKQSTAVRVRDVLYQNITGTSASEVAVKFDCSESFQCERIVLQDVRIERYGRIKSKLQALCQNVRVTGIGVVAPPCPDPDEKLKTNETVTHGRRHSHQTRSWVELRTKSPFLRRFATLGLKTSQLTLP